MGWKNRQESTTARRQNVGLVGRRGIRRTAAEDQSGCETQVGPEDCT